MKKINYYFLVTILLSFTSINRFGNVYAQEAKPEAEATDFMSVIKKKKLAEEKGYRYFGVDKNFRGALQEIIKSF